MPHYNTHPCEHCDHPINYDQTDICPTCNLSIFLAPEDLTELNNAELLEALQHTLNSLKLKAS